MVLYGQWLIKMLVMSRKINRLTGRGWGRYEVKCFVIKIYILKYQFLEEDTKLISDILFF